MEYERLTIEIDERSARFGFSVYGHADGDKREKSSVLYSEPIRQYLDGFGTLEEAQLAYPTAVLSGSTRGYGLALPVEPPAWYMKAAREDSFIEPWDED